MAYLNKYSSLALYRVYDVARQHLDEMYIVDTLLDELKYDDILTEEVAHKLEHNPVYRSRIAKCFREYLIDKISYDDEIDALLFSIKYCANEGGNTNER